MHRCFVAPEDISGKTIILKPAEAKHAFLVLRMRSDEKVAAFDGKGNEYRGIIKSLSSKQGEIQIEKILTHKPKDIKITLAAALPKQSKFDSIVDKATQLGVDKIIPLLTSRTIVKAAGNKLRIKVSRWQEIAVQAAKQCGCFFLPQITPVTDFKTVIENNKDFFGIIPCLHKNTISIKKALKVSPRDIIVFIGPEGDFDEQEIALARKSGILGVSLGENVLRCETAVTTALSIINYEWRS